MNRSVIDIVTGIVLSFWWLTGLFTFDWIHLAMSSLGLWLLWRAREAEGMLAGRSRVRQQQLDEDVPWPMGDWPR